jgi:hypothetical protein
MNNAPARLTFGVVFLSYGSAIVFGCGSPNDVGGPTSTGPSPTSIGGAAGQWVITGNGAAGSAGSGSGAGGGTVISTSSDGTCGSTLANTKRAQADVIIVLDRSESMTNSLSADSSCAAGATDCSTRLAAVKAGVQSVVTNNPSITWGLQLFSSTELGSCKVASTPEVPFGTDSANQVTSTVNAVKTQTSTPTAAAVTAATAYLKSVNDGNSKAILLATDGLPNCGSGTGGRSGGGGTGNDDMPGATAAVTAAKNAGFPVYVVGIGPSTSIANLNELAVAGGTERYYSADTTAALDTALASIAKVVSATCNFKANSAPPDKSLVYVYVDKRLTPESDSSGWKFDATDPTYSTIVLTGSYCEDTLAGRASQVQIVFGCPNVPPQTIIP